MKCQLFFTGILAVVNNAAINIMADVELATMDMYKRVADVNIFGMIRVTKAFAPLIRKYKGRYTSCNKLIFAQITVPLSHLQHICRRRLREHSGEKVKNVHE